VHEECGLTDPAAMNRFLSSVERRAFRIARFAVRDGDEAMDIVQDSMLALVRGYATKPEREWRPLFFRILQSRITDWHRRRTVRSRIFGWWPRAVDDTLHPAELSTAAADAEPDHRAQLGAASEQLDHAVAALPRRQQQAFLLRAWEGLSVEETAQAMRCSQGSVKTHYFRAVQALRKALEDHWQ
jgi:RNA polymerase sigma-70 factor (ECF subfamily)